MAVGFHNKETKDANVQRSTEVASAKRKREELANLLVSANALVASLSNDTLNHNDIEAETYWAALSFLKSQYRQKEPT